MFTCRIDSDLELRLLDMRQAEELYNLTIINRTHLRQWLPWVDNIKSIDDTKIFIEMTQKKFAANQGFEAGIWYQGSFVGVIGYHSYNKANRAISIGYWLGEMYEGKGIMTRACRTFVDFAFKELKLNRVEIQCATENAKSRAIPQRLGFTQEGLVRQVEWLYDHYVDHIIYGMLAEEWQD